MTLRFTVSPSGTASRSASKRAGTVQPWFSRAIRQSPPSLRRPLVITIKEFFRSHEEALGFLPDPEKFEAISAAPDATLCLVAGPGTGKTACLAARILKLMLVDDVPAEGIVATTFTTKAAAELRSRVLDWGFRMTDHIACSDDRLSKRKQKAAAALDVNQVVTGTIYSLCEDMLVRYREPATQPPVVVDEFVATTLLLRYGLFEDARYRSARLAQPPYATRCANGQVRLDICSAKQRFSQR